MTINEILRAADIEVCEDYDYYGEPNGCNRIGGSCKVYDTLQEAVTYLEQLTSKDLIERDSLLAFIDNTNTSQKDWLISIISDIDRFPSALRIDDELNRYS